MQISVIVPIYQSERYIGRCVDSILSQDYTDFELLLIDDGSTDASGAICQEYADRDSRVKVLHRMNGGLSAARNSGIDMAQGKWITFIDSDDAIAQSTFSENMRILESDQDIDILEYPILEHAGSPKESLLEFNPEYMVEGKDVFLDWISSQGYRHCYACNKFFNSHLFKDDPSMRFPVGENFEDISLFIRLIKICKSIYYSNRGRYIYYLNCNGITNTYSYCNMEPLIRNNFHLLETVHSLKEKNDLDGATNWLEKAQCRLWVGCLNLSIDWKRIKSVQKKEIGVQYIDILDRFQPSMRLVFQSGYGCMTILKLILVMMFGIRNGIDFIARNSSRL